MQGTRCDDENAHGRCGCTPKDPADCMPQLSCHDVIREGAGI